MARREAGNTGLGMGCHAISHLSLCPSGQLSGVAREGPKPPQSYSVAALHTLQETGMTITLAGLPGGSLVKNTPANSGDAGSIPGGTIPWRRTWQLNSSILNWRIPWTEKPGGQQSIGCRRVRHDLVTKQRQTSCRLSPNSPGGSSQDHLR